MEEELYDEIANKLCSYYIKEEEEGLQQYILKTTVIKKDERNKVQVLSVGEPSDRPTKCILLLGESGAGKTTIVSAMVNYLFGVKYDSNFRLKVEDQLEDDNRRETESQTDYITVYLLYHHEEMAFEFSLMIVDTPGLADTRGTQQQNSVKSHLEAFLTSDYGIDDISCIGLVAKANTNRDFVFQKELLSDIISLLGNNVPNITHLFATFAVEKPMVDQIVRNAGVKFTSMFEFDNGVLYASPRKGCSIQKRDHVMISYRWENMIEQYQTFFDVLVHTPPVNIKILREKKFLDKSAASLKLQVEELGKLLTALEENRKMLIKYELQEARNKNWRHERRLKRKSRVKVEDGYHAHNCPECNQTCIFPCPSMKENNASMIGGVAGVLGGSAAGAAAAQATATAAARAAASSGYAVTIGSWVTRALGGAAVTAGEVGAVGGIPGVIVGGMVGVTIGAVAGACCGKMLSGASCIQPGRGDVCGEKGCLHSLSVHVKEDERIMEYEDIEIDIDEYSKELHDIAVSKKTDAMAKIVSGGQKILVCKKMVTHFMLKMLFHGKTVCELTEGLEVINPLEILEKLIAEVRLGKPDHIHHAIAILQLMKKAVKALESCPTKEICDQCDVIMSLLECVP
ncbi:uncharacterized protein LOC119592665 [Penaeus monodon]|uniref:uncharacterized protein LOC119592665 n=1 Tax=Penaeus monodon TaxID=6687 RepID=UPI0018A6ED79|nr:uncharacterized protein LOC119592665 [Penaeus monodon]